MKLLCMPGNPPNGKEIVLLLCENAADCKGDTVVVQHANGGQ